MKINMGADKSLCIRIKKSVWLSLKKLSKEHDKSMNLLINELLEKFLKKEEEKRK